MYRLNRIPLSILGLLALITAPIAVLSDEPEGALAGFAIPREWSDTSGKFKVQAKLKFATLAEIQLLKDDGKTIKVPFEKLSAADQAFVQSFLKAEEALRQAGGIPKEKMKQEADNPFAGGDTNDSLKTNGALVKRQVNNKGIKAFSITPSKPFWSVPELRGFPEVSFEEVRSQVSIPKPFFAAMRVMARGKSGTILLNTYQQGSNPNDNYSKFMVLQASTGDDSPIQQYTDPWKLMAMSPDGARAAAVRIEGFDKGNDIAIFKVGAQGIEPEFQFTAGGGSWDELQYVAFSSRNELVTISQKSTFTVWDLEGKPGPKALRQSNSGGTMTAEMSPAGEVLAMIFGNTVAIIENASSKLVGCLKFEQAVSKVAFSSDAESLAIYQPFLVTIYGTKDGKEKVSFAINESNPQAEFSWLGKHLMIGEIVYDSERGVPVWTYRSQPSARVPIGPYLISAFGADDKTTTSLTRIPHEEAIRASSDVDKSKIFAIVPGDNVSVNYVLNGLNPQVTKQVQDAVEGKLQQLGWKVSPSSSKTVTVKIETGKPGEVEYHTARGFGPVPIVPPPGFGIPPGSGPGIKVQYTPWIHTLSISVNGQEVHLSQYQRGAPSYLETKDGESTQEGVLRYCQPFPDYFKNLPIPPHLLKFEYKQGLGASTIDASGLH